MEVRESAVLFDCAGDQLIGILALPDTPTSDVGVLMVVGGPQYRVGSHRQFVLLSRFLADHGFPCMRFDYRGMGDSTGSQRSFEDVDTDIRLAIDTFIAQSPATKRVVLWGLCDGASAACIYAPSDTRLAGLVLLNPWVADAQSAARVLLRNHYLQRFFDLAFWRKFFAGGISLAASTRSLIQNLKAAGTPVLPYSRADIPLAQRMLNGLNGRDTPFVLVLSEGDYVAQEFESAMNGMKDWDSLMNGKTHCGTRKFKTDHTFSKRSSRDAVARFTLDSVMKDFAGRN